MADTLRDFFTPEAGQRRRSWLNEIDGKISDTLGYYLGPQLAPRVEQAANIGALLSPGMDVQDAYTASGEMMAPGRSALDRAGAGAALAGSVAAMFMPGGVSSIRQGIDDLAEAGVRAYDPATTNAFTVWHGSPHDFDRFDMSKIGTGEGAQAYGHGLYFAESPEVARTYRDMLSTDANPYATVAVRDAMKRAGGDARVAREMLQSAVDAYGPGMGAQEALDRFEELAAGGRGRLYEVSIDADPEDFLDWDAPLSAQPERVREALRGLGVDVRDGVDTWEQVPPDEYRTLLRERYGVDSILDVPRDKLEEANALGLRSAGKGRVDPTGQRVLEDMVGGDANFADAATPMLREAGIPGIRYLDAGSRGAGDGSRNYVLFDDSLATILKKYGLAGGAALGAGAIATQPGEAQAATVGDLLWQQEQAKRIRDYLGGVQ
jgi:hypothetical protein